MDGSRTPAQAAAPGLTVTAPIARPAAGPVTLALTFLGVAAAYFALAKLGLAVALLNPSASPVWPASGLAVAAVLLLGYRIAPAIFVGALLANESTAGTLLTSSLVGIGNMLEAVTAAVLINRWCGGRAAFARPGHVVLFAVFAFAPSAMVSATIGVATLATFGYVANDVQAVWLTWWLGDAAGILLLAPAMVLWANAGRAGIAPAALTRTLWLCIAASIAGFVAFNPWMTTNAAQYPLRFVAVLPLLWAALRLEQRDTALAALILSAAAVGQGLASNTPASGLNQTFLFLLTLIVSISVPSLALAADVAERRRAEARLREQEQGLRAIFNQAALGIVHADARGIITSANDKYCDIVGCAREDLLGVHLAELAPVEGRGQAHDRIANAVRDGQGYISERKMQRPDGSEVWLHGTMSVIRGADGKVVSLVAMVEDITARHRAEEQQKVLMAELDHRVRNILATVLATAQLSGHSAASKDEYVQALRGRIAAMARTHALLAGGRWRGAGLREVIEDELRPYAVRPGAMVIRGPDGTVGAKPALNLALVIHELATNAAKYGALSVPDGRVAVTWRVVVTDNGRRHLRLLWQEEGGPPVSVPTRRGFGTRLIERGAIDPGSDVKLNFAPEGVSCLIDMPVPDWTAGEGASLPRAELPTEPPAAGALAPGTRVLVVEDEPILALGLSSALADVGVEIVGPAHSLAQAEALAATDGVAAAVLDVNLGDGMAFALAERLAARGVRLLFVSGYDVATMRPPTLKHVPVLHKPAATDAIVARLRAVLAS